MVIAKVIKNTYTVDPLYQWGRNRVLEVYGLSLATVPEVHFCHQDMGRAIVRQATMDAAGVIRVKVPNSLLQKPYKVQAFICSHQGGAFKTLYKLEIPVNPRNKPEDYTLENDHEVYSFNALENQVTNALVAMNAATADLKAAVASVGPTAEAIAQAVVASLQKQINDHEADKDNPHGVTAAQLGAAKVEFGSYEGTGTAGKDNPVLLTFSAPPKMVTVVPNTLSDIFAGTVFIKGQTENPHIGKVVSSNGSDNGLTVSWDGNTVAWYNDTNSNENAFKQYNESGETYFYCAIL